MERSKQGPVQPSATLRYEFGNLGKHMKLHFTIDQSLLTVVGTSVAALALLTYLRLSERVEGAVKR